MPWFKIYAGLGGGFNSICYVDTVECDNEHEAWDLAYQAAREEYESYEGLHGLLDYDDCFTEALESYLDENSLPSCDPSDLTEDQREEVEDIAENIYEDEIESWCGYYIKSATGSDDRDDKEE